MSRLQELLEGASEGRSPAERAHASIPLSIADGCGPAEIREAIERLDGLAREKAGIEAWDGDARDDVWRAQQGFAELLAALIGRFPAEVAEALQSREADTRFWGAYAFKGCPTSAALDALRAASAREDVDLVQAMLAEAIAACSRQRGWFSRLFGR